MAKFARNTARAHKMVGLVAGFLLLSWTLSGLFFTLYPIETIRGDPWRPVIDHGDLSEMQMTYTAQDVLTSAGEDVSRIELRAFLDTPVWMVESGGSRQMVDAETGKVRSPLSDQDLELLITRFGEKPDGLGTRTTTYLLQESPPREYGGPLPAWVIEYEPGTQRIYVDAISGDIRSVRTTRWRIFDVLWRFHILDVTGDDRFDSWWLKLAAFLGLVMVLSGLMLGIDRFRKGRLLR